MIIYFGADHGGYELKERLKVFVKNMGYEIVDLGPATLDPQDDYTDYAEKVARTVAEDASTRRGILACHSGAGMDIAANKIDGIRSLLGFKPDQVYDAGHDDNVNVLTLAANHLPPEEAENLTRLFLETPFATDERFQRRLKKIEDIEKTN